MNHKDANFTKDITQKLDTLAKAHKNTPLVMDYVLTEVYKPKRSYYVKAMGFAIAAAIAGIIALPHALNFKNEEHNNAQIAVTNPSKLSPQMVEDLEMVMVLGEDSHSHGS
ncbi:hypothetical protein GCM10027155_08660 [Acinetobacter apis]|uniref:Uncharacterized protein n=1 Tax=Acinetobacter apis TaxID=1229165 RepID=A0A217EF16_9GAMM|nr:hypothetical protein [Acinetobacter apis]SNQ28944.1 hypothetical protein SAMN05444584_0875 [Acinetobacter apis]